MRVSHDRIRNFMAPRSGSWYSITNLTEATAELYLYDEISFFGVTADQFRRDLDAIHASEVVVRLNSPGGDVFDGIAIYNALRAHPARITTRVDSLAASIASVIAQAGDVREMMPRGQMMIHEASGVMLGNAEEMLSFAELLDKQSALIADIYAERSGGDAAKFRDLMKAETWLSDQEAVDLGLADQISELPSKQSASDETSTTSNAVDWDRFLAEQEAHNLEGLI